MLKREKYTVQIRRRRGQRGGQLHLSEAEVITYMRTLVEQNRLMLNELHDVKQEQVMKREQRSHGGR